MMKVTKEEIKLNFRGRIIVVPKGVKVESVFMPAENCDKNFIVDFEWLPKVNGVKQNDLIEKAMKYSLLIPDEHTHII